MTSITAPTATDNPAQGTACCVCGTTEARPWRTAPDNLLASGGSFQAVRCVRCGTVRLTPRPSETEMERHYTATTYARAEGEDETSGLAQRLDAFFAHQAERAVAALPENTRPGRLLDVGCGDGRFLRAMQQRGWTVEGLETDTIAANLARRRTGATIHESYLENTPLPDAAFDMVSLLHVLEHVPDPRSTLTAAGRLLRPGGTLLLAVPNVWCLEAALFGKNWYPLDLPRHYWGFTPHTLVRLVEECGFVRPTVAHFPFLFTPQSLRYAVRSLRPSSAVRENVPAAETAVPSKSRNEAGGLRTKLFLTLLNVSERLGRQIPGEVMELTAVRSAS
jgi:SAM-dependent methyltransferase